MRVSSDHSTLLPQKKNQLLLGTVEAEGTRLDSRGATLIQYPLSPSPSISHQGIREPMIQNYNKPLTFEEYLYFYREPISRDLTTKQLRQILFIHGLTKLTNHSKEEIVGAVRLLPLIPPARSTINFCSAQMISADAELTLSLEEVKRDIRDVEWQECPVGSVASVGPAVLGMGCSMPDDASLLKSSLKLNNPLGLYKEDGGGIRKRVRRNMKPLCKVPPGCSVMKYVDHDT